MRRSNCCPKCSVSQLELKSESESKAKRLTLNMALPCSASVPLTTLTSPLLFMFRYLIFSLYSVNYISINSRDLFLFVFVYQFEQFGLRTPQSKGNWLVTWVPYLSESNQDHNHNSNLIIFVYCVCSVLFLCGGKGLEKKLIKILFTLLPWIGYSNWKTFRRYEPTPHSLTHNITLLCLC